MRITFDIINMPNSERMNVRNKRRMLNTCLHAKVTEDAVFYGNISQVIIKV